ncbi:MAG: endonuclease Q family protein [bacterium]|nr:endonuclease Q family protein [bacterium]
MKFIADFHIHSRFSRATSREITTANLAKWAQIKGIKVLGTGDFTHPLWFKELKTTLEPAESGLFKLKSKYIEKKPNNDFVVDAEKTRFILTTEISCIYSKNERVRKIHVLIISPTLEAVEKINTRLEWIGNLKADGRPILGLDAKELLKIVLQLSPASVIIPCHAWTPWFSIFGSKSGFNSLEECFEEYSKYIFAVESGLSSDPAMNWRLSGLDRLAIISNSDCHSVQKMGREANVFDTDLNYRAIMEAIKQKNPKKFLYTIEFFPEEGKYHFDGHRACNICFSPQETKKNKGRCPKCHRPLTIGVLNRVEELADRAIGEKPAGTIPFKSSVPLEEIIGDALGVLPGAKRVTGEYQSLIRRFGDEFTILLETGLSDLAASTLPEITEGIKRVRENKLIIDPGYDGVYGKVRIFNDGEQKTISKQKALF